MVTVVKLACDDVGRGDCVVLIHGHPFDRTLWQPQVAALRDSFRVLVPDLRGFGHSPVTAHLVTMRELAADVEELLDILRIGRAAVIGLSLGGLVTMELAASQPGRYWAIGLIATTMQPPEPAERASRHERADAVERHGMQILIDYMHTGLYGPRCPASAQARVDAIPALVCAGSADPWSDHAVTAEITAHLKHPEPIIIEGAGHLPNLEAEDEFNAILTTFLRTHAPA